MSFGDQVIRTTSAAKKVTLTSTGTANLNISSFTITGTNASDFAENEQLPCEYGAGSQVHHQPDLHSNRSGCRNGQPRRNR